MDKEAIREELKKVRAEIRELKSIFSTKKDEKEDHFVKGEEYSNQINEFYEKIKKIEEDNNLDIINKDLELKKKEYDEFKSQLEILESKFKDIKKNSSEKPKPAVKTISIGKAEKEIKQLDLKLQTQVLSLDKESELIRKIQDLKGQIAEVKGVPDSDNVEFKDAKKELNSVRRKFYAAERKIRSLYKQIRIISKEKKTIYKEIDGLRDLKKKSFEMFRDTKKGYSQTGKDLKDLFKKETSLLGDLGESPVQKKKSMDREIKKKRKEVEENFMKKGGVLTTEDLMMFQKR